MVKKFLTFILFSSLCSPVYGATQQVLINGNTTAVNQNSNTYGGIWGSGGGSNEWTTTETTGKVLWPASGEIKDLRISMKADVDNGGGTQSIKFTVRVNEAEPGTTANCTVTEGVQSGTKCQGSDATTITAGDFISVESNPNNTPFDSAVHWSATWNPTTADESVMTGRSQGADLATSGTEYLCMAGAGGPDSTEFDCTFIAPTAGVFKSFYAALGTAPGGSATRVFTFRDDGASDSVVITFGSGETADNNTVDEISASAGDLFVLVSTVTGTPAASKAWYAIVFDPTIEGEWIIANSSQNNLNISATEYQQLNMGRTNWNGTETNRLALAQTGSFADDMIIKNIYVELENDPGATGDIFTFNLRANSADVTAELEAICDGVQTCNAAATVTISDDDLMGTQVVPTSSPTIGSAMISYTGFITPSVEAAHTQLMMVE